MQCRQCSGCQLKLPECKGNGWGYMNSHKRTSYESMVKAPLIFAQRKEKILLGKVQRQRRRFGIKSGFGIISASNSNPEMFAAFSPCYIREKKSLTGLFLLPACLRQHHGYVGIFERFLGLARLLFSHCRISALMHAEEKVPAIEFCALFLLFSCTSPQKHD